MFGAFVVQFWASHDSIEANCPGRCLLWRDFLRRCISKALKEMGR